MVNGFGLVWDGNSADTCSGNTGDYLRYNNPHKLSMYLASGLPVIIWSQAAEAPLVLEKGVGIAVSSLREIPEVLSGVDAVRYGKMRERVLALSGELRSGYYTKRAIIDSCARFGIGGE